jgi:hypothetical protein
VQGTPAVGEELDDREEDHAGGDVEIIQQHAEQNHAPRHAEHAGNEGTQDDGEGEQNERKGGHLATPY